MLGSTVPGKLGEKSRQRLETEISRAIEMGVSLLVLHPGSSGNSAKKQAMDRLIKALNNSLAKFKGAPVKILLETMAGQGTVIGVNFAELALILNGVEEPGMIGVCLDTAHLWMAGYDIKRKYDQVITEFDKVIGREKIGAIHLNDAKTDLGSRRDRHACPGEGKLGQKTFRRFLTDKRFKNTPLILENPRVDIAEGKTITTLQFLRRLRAAHFPNTTSR
ncbi:MAG: deoxyribonuclease IV [Candidatus Berkelbacteria bacterium Licking1014_2]|uniref:Deoxyribonuclease IV n=1 Tax=Candidatus Berkelbacteria bacterium Licking1014_2 TaxID=2017146 RepID=A0A554LRR1_9BACT|nr:MAG: deoxyribonuclease IV [Candidatus Berkelbacteria bacterium Licking1014_2]